MSMLQPAMQMISNHPYLTPFISGLIQEEVLIITTLLSGAGAIPFYSIFLFGFLGILISDIFWFLIIKIKPLFAFAKRVGKIREKTFAKSKISKLPPPTNLKSFILCKLIYGLRSWAIFYCSVHKQSLKQFIVNTSIATFIWLLIMVTLSKAIGKFLYFVFDITKDVGLILIILVAIIVIWSLVMRYAIRKFTRN